MYWKVEGLERGAGVFSCPYGLPGVLLGLPGALLGVRWPCPGGLQAQLGVQMKPKCARTASQALSKCPPEPSDPRKSMVFPQEKQGFSYFWPYDLQVQLELQFGPSWSKFGQVGAMLGPSWCSWAPLGLSCLACWASCKRLGRSLGSKWAPLGAFWAPSDLQTGSKCRPSGLLVHSKCTSSGRPDVLQNAHGLP